MVRSCRRDAAICFELLQIGTSMGCMTDETANALACNG
jgi:hypothetical protein